MSVFSDALGRLVFVPKQIVNSLLASGQKTATFTISLIQGAAPRDWLTLTEAAQLHTTDVDGLTLNAARVAVQRACVRGDIIAEGAGQRRRIDPDSLDAWRLRRREADLAVSDEHDE